MELNNIPNEGRYGWIANKINDNFDIIRVKIGDVVYATRKNKGLFASSTALSAAIPSPLVGDWALVGNDFPADIYVCTTAGSWTDSGNDYSGQLLFCIDTAKLSSAVGWSDSLREFGKKSQDCMNLVSIDRYSKTVTFYRIGCDTNRLGMTKQVMCWDYANCKMLYNR